MQSGRDLAAAAVVRTVRSSVCLGCRMGRVIRYVFSEHVNLRPSSHSLVAAAEARKFAGEEAVTSVWGVFS